MLCRGDTVGCKRHVCVCILCVRVISCLLVSFLFHDGSWVRILNSWEAREGDDISFRCGWQVFNACGRFFLTHACGS